MSMLFISFRRNGLEGKNRARQSLFAVSPTVSSSYLSSTWAECESTPRDLFQRPGTRTLSHDLREFQLDFALLFLCVHQKNKIPQSTSLDDYCCSHEWSSCAFETTRWSILEGSKTHPIGTSEQSGSFGGSS